MVVNYERNVYYGIMEINFYLYDKCVDCLSFFFIKVF